MTRKVYQVRYHMVDDTCKTGKVTNTGKATNTGKVLSFPSVCTYEYYEDAVDEMLDSGFEPYGTLGSSFSWKRDTDREGFYTLGTIERVEE